MMLFVFVQQDSSFCTRVAYSVPLVIQVYDRPPDPNGIASFCAVPRYKKYCDNGQVRVLYIHETEALGPAVAR